MEFHLVCVHPIVGRYKRGDKVTDPQEVAHLLQKHDKRFVKVSVPAVKAEAPRAIEVDGVEYDRVESKRSK